MSIEIKDLVEQNIADGADISYSGSVSKDKIQIAENMLGVVFPPSYRDFLEQFGAIEIDGFPFSGLSQGDVGKTGDVVVFTKYCRSEYGLPEQYIALNFQDGDYFLSIDTAALDSSSEAPIVLIDPVKKKRHGNIVALSFGEYLASYLLS